MNEQLTQALTVIKEDVESRFFPWVVEEIIIDTAAQLKNMSDLLTVGKRIEKDATAKLAEITKPILEQEKEARDAFRPLLNRIHLGVFRIDQAVIAYHGKIKNEADALLLMQAQEQAAKIAEARETGEVIELEQKIVEPVQSSIRGQMSTTSIKETPEFTVIKPDEVERHLCSPDLKKIKSWYSLGNNDIKGVLITSKTHTVSRFR